jgi:hypothetical protein
VTPSTQRHRPTAPIDPAQVARLLAVVRARLAEARHARGSPIVDSGGNPDPTTVLTGHDSVSAWLSAALRHPEARRAQAVGSCRSSSTSWRISASG